MECEGVGLVLGCEGCRKVKLCYCEEVATDDTAMGNWWLVSIRCGLCDYLRWLSSVLCVASE